MSLFFVIVTRPTILGDPDIVISRSSQPFSFLQKYTKLQSTLIFIIFRMI
jgi:hypothetical protein